MENNIIEKYTPQVNGNIGSPYIHLLGDKALYRHNYNWLYVDAINESYQFIADIYGLIIGVFDNKIVDYVFLNDDTFEIRFWEYENISEPELIYSYNSLNLLGYNFVQKLDEEHLLMNRGYNLSVLDISDEDNYHFVSDFEIDFLSIIDIKDLGKATKQVINTYKHFKQHFRLKKYIPKACIVAAGGSSLQEHQKYQQDLLKEFCKNNVTIIQKKNLKNQDEFGDFLRGIPKKTKGKRKGR